MRADLYTLALISALEEEHPLRLAQPDPGTITVNGQVYGIYTTAEPDAKVFDLPAPVTEGEEPATTLQSVIDDAAAELQNGTAMIVVNRALLTPLRDLLDPPPPEPVQYKKRFDPLEFMDLFSKEVQQAIFIAARDNVDIDIARTRMMAGPVSVDSDEVVETIASLLAASLITPVFHDSMLRGQPVNLSIDNAQTTDDWRELALSMLETPPAERLALDIEVIKIIPDIDKLEAFVEGEGIGKVNRSYTLENARQAVLSALGA